MLLINSLPLLDLQAQEGFLSKCNNNDVFDTIGKSDIRLTEQEKAEHQAVFWRSICSEYDARRLDREIRGRLKQCSKGLTEFLDSWLADEAEHTIGFKRLYSLIYDVSDEELEDRLQDRPSDFSVLAPFLEDEFSICLLLAYDEMVTTFVYHLSLPFYRTLGMPAIVRWIDQVKRDEARHFAGVMRIATQCADGGVERGREILGRIIRAGMNQSEYQGTFVLDHACPEFPFTISQLNEMCERGILRKIKQTQRSGERVWLHA